MRSGADTQKTAQDYLAARNVLAALLLVIAIVFVLQNRAETSVSFIVTDVRAPLWIALMATFSSERLWACSPHATADSPFERLLRRKGLQGLAEPPINPRWERLKLACPDSSGPG